MNKRIFIIDDDPDMIRILRKLLENAGYLVNYSTDPTEGLQKLSTNPPDLLLLDILMPQMDGLQICKEIKSHPKLSHIPIVMLSAQSSESDVAVGLELGADDYVVKPFRAQEFLARVKTTLRRASSNRDEIELSYGPFRVDFGHYKAWINQELLELTPKEFEILGFFLRKEGRIVTRAALSENIWGADISKASRAMDIAVERLRKKLGPYGVCLQSLRGVGYRFEI